MTTGDKIAAERRALNLTQEQLATKLNVSRQAVSRWESDLAFPETDKIIKLAEIFNRSIDWLLRDIGEKNYAPETDKRVDDNSDNDKGKNSDGVRFGECGMYYEYKSKRTLFGLPLVHINWGSGRTVKGIIAVGVRAKGIISIGIFSLGVVSFGVCALGVFALAAFAMGFMTFGSISISAVAFGAIAIGLVASGAIGIGLIANGSLAVGAYFAIGDTAFGQIAVATSKANGSKYSLLIMQGDSLSNYKQVVFDEINRTVPEVLRWLARIMVNACSIAM